MRSGRYILIHESAAPSIMLSVLEAKRLLDTGEAKSVGDAIKRVGISRSVYYKYKDCIFDYSVLKSGRLVTLCATLRDVPGVLSKVVAKLSELGANIITINQNSPVGDLASVLISARTDDVNVDDETLSETISNIDGVVSVYNSGEQNPMP